MVAEITERRLLASGDRRARQVRIAGDAVSRRPRYRSRGERGEVTKRFTITYDYLCPFARIANEAVIEAIETGRAYQPTFAPFSLSQNSLDEGMTAVWDRPAGSDVGRGVDALLWSLAVRDTHPDRFAAMHLGLFAARHDDGADLADREVLGEVAVAAGLDPVAIASIVDGGGPMDTLRAEHTALVDRHGVFGVPTFIAGDEAVFVRFMERHRIGDLDRVVDMITWTNVNEFKRTRIPR
jgi:hypothetical protein